MEAKRWLKRVRGASSLLLTLAVFGACAHSAAQAPAGEAAAPWDPEPEAPTYPGFDVARYPGDETMRLWRRDSPYRWVGYYLAAPCHRDESWMGTRERLAGMGWGMAVLYVGQQYFEEAGPNIHIDEGSLTCSRTLLTAAQAVRDARDAAEKAEREGFAPGTIVYLDLERVSAPDTLPRAVVTYATTWIEEMVRDRRYQPGLYAHHSNAPALYAFAYVTYRRLGVAGGAPFWVSGGENFSLQARPAASGYPFADVWQGAHEVERSWGGVSLRIDESVSRAPSPSIRSE